MSRPRRRRSLRRAAERLARRATRRARRSVRRSALAALTSSALALPGLGGTASAGAPAEEWSMDYATSFYRESDLDASKLSVGSAERYEIATHQLQLTAPVLGRADLGLNLIHETMSGASPWYVEADTNGEPVQVMSGASIEDQRTDLLGRGSFYFDNAKASLLGGVSTEKDYFAVNGGLEVELELNEKNTTLGGGIGFSLDQIDPTDQDLFPTRPDGKKQSYSAFGSIAQVLSRSAAIQSSLSLQHSTGLLSDPYKLVSTVADGNIQDSRPDQRNQLAWLTRYRHHFSALGGTLHADYRFYLDDWDLTSHTLELAWYQTLWQRLRLIPSLRYYSQSQAEFYGPFFDATPADGLASSDYRLSPFGALSWKLRAETVLEDWPFHVDWRIGIAWERYLSSGDFALKRVSLENPGLVDWDLFSVHVSARF